MLRVLHVVTWHAASLWQLECHWFGFCWLGLVSFFLGSTGLR
jgi:hypothetical protein